MEKTRSGLRRRSERLQNDDARDATTRAPPIQRQPRTSIPSEKRRVAPRRSAPKARPKRSKDQKTLTQIDFVTRSNPTPDLDLDLDYIEHEVPDPPRKSRSKGKEKKAKIDRKQSNTLTQMDYVVRRPWDDDEELVEDMPHVPGTDDEDDDDLERTGTPPRWEAVQNENNLGSAYTPSPGGRAKRRRLESIAPVSPTSFRPERIGKRQTGNEKENEGLNLVSNQPPTDPGHSLHPASKGGNTLQVTPKKQQKWEIPSSQSPDSPGLLMMGTSSRSPLKTKSLNSPLAPTSRKQHQTPSSAKVASWSTSHSKQPPKGDVPGSPITVESQCTPRTLVTEGETPGTSPMPAALGEAQKANCSRPQSPMGTKPTSQEEPRGPQGVYKPKDINLPKTSIVHEVCDTDAESEDEFHDTHSSLSEQDSHPHLTDLDDTHGGEIDSGNTRSPPKSGLDPHPYPDEADAIPDHSTALTDASILYHRRPQDDARDPTASELDIDSERLAELFPQNEQETIGSTLPAWPIPDSTPQQQPSTQNPPDISTEFIPESSQRPIEGETHDIPNSSPPEVILVESSQPNDLPTRGERRDSDSAPKDIFTTSQLLPDSLMESIPGPPPEWTFSDDFIHE